MEGGGPGHFAHECADRVAEAPTFHVDGDSSEDEWGDEGEPMTIDVSEADLVRAERMAGARNELVADDEGDEDEADDYGYGDRGWRSSDDEDGGDDGQGEDEEGELEGLGFGDM